MQSLVEIDPMVLLKRFFDLVNVLLFRNYLSLRKCVAFSFKQTLIPFT